ncbi:MAG: hypothetical protein U5K43_07665 [Halofilum sp. (in: g-proteobacteria)]|nr:hypothetical protein [Halofilum sp. (in: g-proteobacteria)]
MAAPSTDRGFERLPAPAAAGARATLAAAADALDGWRVRLAGVDVDGPLLAALAATPAHEPHWCVPVRERLGRPVDLPDFLYFLDDVATAGARGLRGAGVWVPSGRARGAGILVHPDDVFGAQPRRYGGRPLAIFRPARPADLEPAVDGDPLGPRWTARYRNPQDEAARLDALERAGHPGFAARLRELLAQFRAQGAEAWVFSTVRSRERGYLIYGAFILSRADTADAVERRVAELERLNREWGLQVPIRWRHPDGWRATVTAARAMAEAYNVVYATRSGARRSSHYDGTAADFAVVDLPRRVTLRAPGGAERSFDLSDPAEPRDLNLTPRLIAWVEAHFRLDKLRGDYPHWSDAAAR